jgi:hypothetical protein
MRFVVNEFALRGEILVEMGVGMNGSNKNERYLGDNILDFFKKHGVSIPYILGMALMPATDIFFISGLENACQVFLVTEN